VYKLVISVALLVFNQFKRFHCKCLRVKLWILLPMVSSRWVDLFFWTPCKANHHLDINTIFGMRFLGLLEP